MIIKNYFKHLYVNTLVACKCFVLAVLHLAHGVVPVKYTSHEYWKM